MAKLKCDLHHQRVVAVNGKFIHRQGFGYICPSETASIRGAKYTAEEIKQFGLVKGSKDIKDG